MSSISSSSRAAFLLGATVLVACASGQHSGKVDSGADKPVAVPAPSPRSAEARADSEEVVASGGEIDLSQLPPATVERVNGEVIAWGLSEVPGDSRLQAALALADANARAELIAAVRVGIASSLTATSSETRASSAAPGGPQPIESQEITERTAQVANGILPALAPAQHGWRKVRRHGELVLLVCSRIAAREDALISALAPVMKGAPDPVAQARQVLEQLGKGHRLGAE